jgi:hypothetical protein
MYEFVNSELFITRGLFTTRQSATVQTKRLLGHRSKFSKLQKVIELAATYEMRDKVRIGFARPRAIALSFHQELRPQAVPLRPKPL